MFKTGEINLINYSDAARSAMLANGHLNAKMSAGTCQISLRHTQERGTFETYPRTIGNELHSEMINTFK